MQNSLHDAFAKHIKILLARKRLFSPDKYPSVLFYSFRCVIQHNWKWEPNLYYFSSLNGCEGLEKGGK